MTFDEFERLEPGEKVTFYKGSHIRVGIVTRTDTVSDEIVLVYEDDDGRKRYAYEPYIYTAFASPEDVLILEEEAMARRKKKKNRIKKMNQAVQTTAKPPAVKYGQIQPVRTPRFHVPYVHYGLSVKQFFEERGFEFTREIWDADLVVFTGGEDVSPELYGEKPLVGTFLNKERDRVEQEAFKDAISANIPMVGICRGGQLLNVLSGGKMYQDADGHGGSHLVATKDGREFLVTSTHHQIMIPSKEADIIAVATHKNKYVKSEVNGAPLVTDGIYGYEVLYYEDTQCLCFQPHPEYVNCPKETVNWFFELINDYLGVKT